MTTQALARFRQLDPIDRASLGIASVAAGASYVHGVELLFRLGESWPVALLVPLTVDTLAIVCLVKLRTTRGWFRLTVVWAMFGLALSATLAANWLAAKPVTESRIVALWPPVCLLAVELVRMATAVTVEPVSAVEVAEALALIAPPPALEVVQPLEHLEVAADLEVAPVAQPVPAEVAEVATARVVAELTTDNAPAILGSPEPRPARPDYRQPVIDARLDDPTATQAQVAERVGCDVRTVRRHWAAATEALADQAEIASITPDDFITELTGDQQ